MQKINSNDVPGVLQNSSCDSFPLSSRLKSTSPRKSSAEMLPIFRSSSSIPSSPHSERHTSTSPQATSTNTYGDKVVFPRTGSSKLYDKALPPLPDAAGSAPLLRQLPATPISREGTIHDVVINSSSTSKAFSTSALAHAGLELGMTPVMPSTAQLPCRVNTVANDTHPFNDPPSPVLRKSKSSSKLKLKTNEPKMSASQSDSCYHRVRGFSFGSHNILNFTGDSKVKGKEKDTETGKTPLSRRGSFWSRRRQAAQSSEANLLASSPSSPAQPSIPYLAKPADRRKQPHARGLSRSLSERSFLSRSSPPVLENGSYISSRSPRTPRPSSARVPQPANWPGFPGPTPKVRHPRGSNDPNGGSQARSRPRAQTNPPLLHRLSLNIFSFATFPSPVSDIDTVINPIGNAPIYSTSPTVVTSARDDETPSDYVQRLLLSVNKSEISAILASSAELFHTQSLQIYIDNFDFVNEPLDIAMRKLLMHVGLPRETQQIDRVIEAFARRYRRCNPGLFISDDHPYILAFSLMMLHTDAFNKSNKRKMSKGDYVKNTRLPGVAPDVLECFYDNIVFAPFIFIEDSMEINGKSAPSPDISSTRTFASISSPSLASNGNSGTLLKGNRIDPYYLIVHNLLAPLRVDVHRFVPPENPFSYEGTIGPWDIDQLQRDFTGATVLLVDGPHQWQDSSEAYTATGALENIDTAGCFTHIPSSLGTASGLKVIKVGLLNKKEDILVGSKKATNRKWRPWTVMLTTSHLLFFRDLALVTTLRPYLDSSHRLVKFPHSVTFKPDNSLTICESIAVYDQSYTKYNNVFRFVMSDGRQILLQAPQEKEMNDWMSRINYASTFKTAQIRVRPPTMTGRMVELTGMAAAASHLQDIQHRRQSVHLHDWNLNPTSGSSDTLLGDVRLNGHAQLRTDSSHSEEVGIPVAPEVEGADQFKATFDQVKADLAAGLWAPLEDSADGNSSTAESIPTTPLNGDSVRLPSRFHVTQSKVETLQERIATTQGQLDSNMRVVHNIALLTPFQKASRDRLEAALRNIAGCITESRIKLTKQLCYHDTLCRDLSSEVRSWGEGKKIAFQAAQQTLKKHYDHLTRSPATYSDAPQRPRSRSGSSSEHSSSLSESFYSALDTRSDRPSLNEALAESSDLGSTLMLDSTRNGELVTVESKASSARPSSSDTSHDCPRGKNLVQNRREREEAENWDKTRCAQRVSLVRLPSTLQMAKLRALSE